MVSFTHTHLVPATLSSWCSASRVKLIPCQGLCTCCSLYSNISRLAPFPGPKLFSLLWFFPPQHFSPSDIQHLLCFLVTEFCSLLCSQHQEECLAQSMCSLNICQTDGITAHTKKDSMKTSFCDSSWRFLNKFWLATSRYIFALIFLEFLFANNILSSHQGTDLIPSPFYLGHECHSLHSSFFDRKKCPVDKLELMYRDVLLYLYYTII